MKFLILFFLLILISSCTSTGINKDPSEKKVSDKTISKQTMRDVSVKIIEINKLSIKEIEKYSL